MLTAAVGILVAANLGEEAETWRVAAYAMFVGFCVGALLLAFYAMQLAAPATLASRIGYWLELLAPVAAVVAILPQVRAAVGRGLRAFSPESPVHAVALGLYVLIFLTQVAGQLQTDQLKSFAAQQSTSSLLFQVGTVQVPMILVAIAGVGIFVRRDPAAAAKRLGLIWPRWRWIAASFAVVLLLLGLDFLIGIAIARYTPTQNKELQQVTQQMLRVASTIPLIVVLGIAAGVGEELLFRGALLPRFGNVAAALLFASFHAQYALSLATLEILLLGLILGWLRRRAGTTGCIIAHSGYDIAVGILATLH